MNASSDDKFVATRLFELFPSIGYIKQCRTLAVILCTLLALTTLGIFGIGAAGCIPVINGLSAYQGAPGNVITINGSFFGSTPQANRVFLGDELEMHVITASASKLTAMVPYDEPGTYSLRVETSAGASTPKKPALNSAAYGHCHLPTSHPSIRSNIRDSSRL